MNRYRKRNDGQSRGDRWLARAATTILGVGITLHLILGPSTQAGQTVWTLSLSAFFVLLLARLVVTAVRSPARRSALICLMAAVTFWAAGSVSVSAIGLDDLLHFPAPGEWLFLASYAGFVGYLIRDAVRRIREALTDWLDVLVICGGTACLTASLLLTPVAAASGVHGLSLLLALLYPIMDLALAIGVAAQVILCMRSDVRSTVWLVGGFILLACADSSFVLQVSSSTYHFSALNDALWGAAFSLVVSSACRAKPPVKDVPRPQGHRLMLSAGVTSIVALGFGPAGELGPYVASTAIVTLFAAAARLAVALRDANRAAEAFALSLTDDLTKLPNRRAIRQHMDAAIARGRAHALMLLDLDGFKEINDTLGHAAGDTVLKIAAVRMQGWVPSDGLIARLGGDEFAILMYGSDELLIMEAANDLLNELSKPLRVDGIEIVPSASIGVTRSQRTDSAGSEVLRRADVAMYQAKSARRGVAMYDVQADEFSRHRLQLAETLRRGIAAGEMELWYQPQIHASSGELCGLEALVRWRHPQEGVLSPVAFLPAARRGGLMGVLSDEVGEMAVRDLHRWREAGLNVRVALNCAPPELLSGVFLPRLYEHMRKANVPGDRFVLEVTEDSFLAEPERARSILHEVQQHGLQVSIDDYGTGFSSLAYLRDLPMHELKIDRSFINAISSDPRSRMIVASTIQMAHGLELRVVAEGVEDAETAADLVAMGVDVLQGYHFAAPIPPDRVEAWVRAWTQTRSFAFSTDAFDQTTGPVEDGRETGSGRSTRIMAGRRALHAQLVADPSTAQQNSIS